MFSVIIICFLITNSVAQFDGNFWWLNQKLAKYNGETPPPPTFEELTEFDTDESAKITFRDNEVNSNISRENIKSANIERNGKAKDIHFKDKTQIVWPSNNVDSATDDRYSNIEETSNNKKNKIPNREDVFEFRFPDDDNLIWSNADKNNKNAIGSKLPNVNSTERRKPNMVLISNNKVPIQVITGQTQESESICTFIKKSECENRSGFAYFKKDRGPVKGNICCILPISSNNISSKIYFFDDLPLIKNTKRPKRSTPEDKFSSALKQRYALLMKKYGSQQININPTSPTRTKITQKIVTPDNDYGDPYWNIKHTNFKTPQFQNEAIHGTTDKYDYHDNDYVEDYTVELPKPGLVALYSDNNGNSPSWSVPNGYDGSTYGDVVYDEVTDNPPSFGYGSTVDPRLDRLPPGKLKPSKHNSKPSKMTERVISSEEYSVHDSESQTITYQASPDFQVLNGFKLLNLVTNKNKVIKNDKKTTTTENVFENDSKETVLIDSDMENDYDDTSQQVFGNCGKTGVKEDYGNDGDLGDTERVSHPWLALVVLTRKPQTILCYATILHPRAAITTAECVHGRNNCPGEVTVVAGVWNLKQEANERWQKRIASIIIHEHYTPGELDNNLAILYWRRPLRFNMRVQPLCLSDPHVGDDCRFYGWGGYDQAIRPRSRWQRASILTPRQCKDKMSSKMETIPRDTFCASVHSRGTVTGAGGSLVCSAGGRRVAAGVAVWRDNVVILAPTRQWTEHALAQLPIH